MKKVLFTYDYGPEKMSLVRDLDYDLMIRKETDLRFETSFEDVDVLVCYNPFTTLDVAPMKKLDWIQLSSIGIDQAPLMHIQEKDIILTNNRGGYSIPMGEWIVLKVLESYKDSKYFYHQQENRQWHMHTGLLELVGKTIGFVGTGTIAQEAAKRLQGFDMKVLGVNTTGHETRFFNRCYPMASVTEVLQQCDVVVLTIPYTPKTHHLINHRMLGFMKDDAVMINVSRGSIIDEPALAQAQHLWQRENTQ